MLKLYKNDPLNELAKGSSRHLRRKEAFREERGIQGGESMQGGKRHSRREKAFKEGRGILGGKFTNLIFLLQGEN